MLAGQPHHHGQVAAFCALHSFLGCREGVGCMRFDIGRPSNVEIMFVGVPIVFKVIGNRGEGLVTTTMTFTTLWAKWPSTVKPHCFQ